MRFPLAGIDRTMGFHRQPNRPLVNGDFARTTVSAHNVRAFDPRTDRARGGSRPGIAKYGTNQVNGSNSIQDLNYVTVTALITGGSGNVPGWGASTPHIFLRKAESVGLCYGTSNSEWSVQSLGFNSEQIAAIGSSSGSTVFVVEGSILPLPAQVTRWRILSNGQQVAQGTIPGNPAGVSCSVATDGTSFYLVWCNKGTTAPGNGTFGALKVNTSGSVQWSTANLGNLTQTGVFDQQTSTVVVSGVVYTSIVGTGIVQINATTGAVGSPMIRVSAVNIRDSGAGRVFRMQRNVAKGLVAAGNLLAIAVESNQTGNYRRGIVFYNLSSDAFSPSALLGPDITDADGNPQDAPGFDGNFIKLASDGTNFYALLGNSDVVRTNPFAGRVPSITLDGANNFVIKVTAATGAEAWGSERYGDVTKSMIYSSSLDKVVVSGPNVSSFLDPTTGDAAGGGLGSNILGFYDAGTVNTLGAATSDDGETVGGYNRALCVTAVAGGTMKVLFQGEWQSVNAGGGTLSSTARVVRSAVIRRKMYFTDDLGANYALYSPVTNSLDNWTPTSGTMPVDGIGKKARLIAPWRDRIILSGLPEDPSNIFASAQGDPRNWNYAPLSPSPSQAWALNTAQAGQIPDIVTALMPYSDDYLYVGCDHELWRISGDPASGGKVDMVSRQLGVAWGKSWCTDPFGNLYIFGNDCGVYTLTPNEQPIRISQPIDSILRDTDLRKCYVTLAWNDRLQGMHVFVTHRRGAEPEQHYFWEQRTGAWWVDRFTDNDHNPVCNMTFQGNTGTGRVVVIGSFDGYVRFVTDAAPNDDGEDIESEIWLGPILTKDLDDILLKDSQFILGEESGPVTGYIHTGATAEEAFNSDAKDEFTLSGGRSSCLPTRWSGHAIYARLVSSSQWSEEEFRARFSGTGKVRQRSHN